MVFALTALLVSLLFTPAASAAVTAVSPSASASGNGSASAQLTVPAGANRFLAVGVSTLESATVTGVSYGAQVLTREWASAQDSSRAEVWVLKAPNVGTATVAVTLSTGAPVVVGATSFTGVDQALPVIASSSMDANNGSNSAGLTLNQNVEDDGMFGVLTVNDSDNITAIRTTGSVDTVVADQRWTGRQGTVLSAGATRRGNTFQNMAIHGTGIHWYWNRIDPSRLMPYSTILTGLRAATTAAPTVGFPIASAITHESATLSASVADTGGEAVTERGVVYCTGACSPQIGGAGVTQRNAGAGDTGPFELAVSGLQPSTTYTFRGFATNAKGTTYTAATPFTTAPQPNRAPTADAGGPYAIDEGGSLTLAGSGTDPDGDPLQLAWDLDGDGQFDDAAGAAPTLTRAQLAALGLDNGPVTRSIRVSASDGHRVTLSAPTSVTVRNVAPTATLTGDAVDEGKPATVAFSGQTDPVDATFTYEWSVDGAAFTPGDATLTVPTTDGGATLPVRGAIIDADGGRREYTAAVTVRNVAPTAKVADVTVDEGATATVAVTDIGDVAADTPGLRFAYDLDGDGTFAAPTTDTTATLPAADGPASRDVGVRVTDKDGGESTYTAKVTVDNVAPSGTLANNGAVKEGGTAQVSWAGVTDPSTADTTAGVRYAYDFDDDGTWDLGGATYATASTAATVDVPTALTADGDRDVTVRAAVLDKDGGAREHTTTIKVENVAPTATLTGATVNEGETATVAFSAQADPGDSGFSYEWDVDGAGFQPGGATLAVPAATGAKTIPVKGAILDGDGGRTEYATTVVVRNVAPAVTISGTDAVPSSGAVKLTFAARDLGPVTGTIDWGDGTVVPFAAGAVSHTYAGAGARTVTVRVTDADGAQATAAHALTVASLPAPHSPAPAPASTSAPAPAGRVLGAVESNPRISGVRVTPRCISAAANLRAVSSAARTIKVQFRLNTKADVRFSLKRAKKAGFTKCPPATGVAQKGGRKVPGVYSPFSKRAVEAKRGLNTVTLAATDGKGKALKPGTYLLTLTSGDTTARTKVWVLAG